MWKKHNIAGIAKMIREKLSCIREKLSQLMLSPNSTYLKKLKNYEKEKSSHRTFQLVLVT